MAGVMWIGLLYYFISFRSRDEGAAADNNRLPDTTKLRGTAVSCCSSVGLPRDHGLTGQVCWVHICSMRLLSSLVTALIAWVHGWERNYAELTL